MTHCGHISTEVLWTNKSEPRRRVRAQNMWMLFWYFKNALLDLIQLSNMQGTKLFSIQYTFARQLVLICEQKEVKLGSQSLKSHRQSFAPVHWRQGTAEPELHARSLCLRFCYRSLNALTTSCTFLEVRIKLGCLWLLCLKLAVVCSCLVGSSSQIVVHAGPFSMMLLLYLIMM